MAIAYDTPAFKAGPKWTVASIAPAIVSLVGLALVFGVWWIAGLALEGSPRLVAFRGFTIGPTLASFADLLTTGAAWHAAAPSLARIGQGLLWAFVIGAPVGLAIGSVHLLEALLRLPFQILRMVSPLAWMPIAVLLFASWDDAIIFLIAAAAIWPIVFSTAAGVRHIDPVWLAMANNLGGNRFAILRTVVIPAVARDILSGSAPCARRCLDRAGPGRVSRRDERAGLRHQRRARHPVLRPVGSAGAAHRRHRLPD